MCDFGDMTRLSSLLNHNNDNDSSDDDMPEKGPSTYSPAIIGKKSKKKDLQPSPYEKITDAKEGDIWGSHEVASSGWDIEDEGKIRPEYDIAYKQKVSSGDMFLGMSGKTPSSACCEDMLVTVKLPDAQLKDIDLEIEDDHLDIRHAVYRLHLHLPHPVDPKLGTAKWEPTKEELRITLRMKREYDFLNF